MRQYMYQHRWPNTAGEANKAAKLTRSDVDEIRRLAAAGVPRRSLAERYGVTVTTIRKIVVGLRWR